LATEVEVELRSSKEFPPKPKGFALRRGGFCQWPRSDPYWAWTLSWKKLCL